MPVVLAAIPALLLVALPAYGQDWQTTFAADALATWLDSPDAVVLVAAGAADEGVRRAATALEIALRSSGRVASVLNDLQLGDLSSASDAEIVARANGLQVDRLLVVRVFPGAPGQAEVAVVTGYDRQGNRLWSFSAAAGSPAPRREGKLADAPRVEAEPGVPASDAQERYDERFVWFEDGTWLDKAGRPITRFSFVYQGKYKRRLTGEDLYLAIGRPDLAAEYGARALRAQLLQIGGLVAAGGGATLFTFGVLAPCRHYLRDICIETDYRPAFVGGLAAVAGLVSFWIGSATERDPVDMPTARRLADEHNERLKRELGLSSARARASAIRLSLSPALGLRAPGLLLSARF